MKDSYISAAISLCSNPSYKILKEAMLEQLSSDVGTLINASDSVVARAYVHDAGIRNFFRWVEKAAQSAPKRELAAEIRPFNHYGEEETENTK